MVHGGSFAHFLGHDHSNATCSYVASKLLCCSTHNSLQHDPSSLSHIAVSMAVVSYMALGRDRWQQLWCRACRVHQPVLCTLGLACSATSGRWLTRTGDVMEAEVESNSQCRKVWLVHNLPSHGPLADGTYIGRDWERPSPWQPLVCWSMLRPVRLNPPVQMHACMGLVL